MKKNIFKPQMGKGDSGCTDIKSKRVKKTDTIILLNAMLDELNALLGFCRSQKADKKIFEIQKELLDVSAVIAGYKDAREAQKLADNLAEKIRELPLKKNLPEKFLIFGKDKRASILNLARAKARIAEIKAWEAGLKKPAVYLNRLSDYLFLLSLE